MPGVLMRLGVVVLRRFVARGDGGERLTEVCRAAELAIPPVPGMVLAFGDDSGDCTVSRVRHTIGAPAGFGVLPVEVELICMKEPMLGLEACLQAGWQRVDVAAAGPEPAPPAAPSR